MKITVCELSNQWMESGKEKEALLDHIDTNRSEFLLLPEMAFHTWLAGSDTPSMKQWEEAVASHARWIENLEQFNVSIVAGTRPILKEKVPHNEAFIWTKADGVRGVHEKYYLPDEAGYWEATWYRRGDGTFASADVNGLKVGFLICTELWFNHRAREYGKEGIHLLLCPRATPSTSTSTWVAGGQAAANVSGAFCLSSNFNGKNTSSSTFGGTGWIIEPEEGFVLGKTREGSPFLTLDIDISQAEKAKATYPRYVPD